MLAILSKPFARTTYHLLLTTNYLLLTTYYLPARWDVDGDAVLDIDEFRNLWHELSVAAYLPPQPPGYEGRAPMSVTVPRTPAARRRVHVYRRRVCVYAWSVSYIQVAPKLSEEQIGVAFEHSDIDGGGDLDINEVRAATTCTCKHAHAAALGAEAAT